jgi:Uma2 family endonuclease
VLEVADSSLDKDTGTKSRVYASFGVREYWVINAQSKSTRIYRAPNGDTYADVRDVPSAEVLTPLRVPQLAARLADLDLD